MTETPAGTADFRVVTNRHGRYSLWPAGRPVPPGWAEALPPRPRADCLEFVRRAWTSLRPAARPPRRLVDFGLLFFGGDEGGNSAEKYEFVIEAARYADANGFSAVWLPERHFTAMGSLYPNPAVLHAALARETKHVRLRSGSVVLPLHDPVRVAEEWAVVDNLSHGRVELSFAPGWNVEDFALRPGCYGSRYQLMYDGMEVVGRLWRGESVERPDGNGRPVRVRTYPTPVQQRLVRWVTVAGSADSFRQAGRAGANLLTHLFDQDVAELAGKIADYRRARREHGHEPEGRVAVTLHTFLADDADDVRRHARPAYNRYLKENMKLLEKLAQSRNVPVDLTRMRPEELDEAIDWLFDKFLSHRSLMGTPESCAPLVADLAAAGVQEIACLIDFGPSPQAVLAGLPKLKELMERANGVMAG